MAVLLLVTNEFVIRRSIQYNLEISGHVVYLANSLNEGTNMLGEVECVICDHQLPDGSGIDFIELAHPTPVILLVEQISLQHGILAMKKGAFDCLVKPCDAHNLLRITERATEAHRATPADGMIGECKSVTLLKKQIARVSPLNTTVLIGGESGTGKELVAKAIHKQSTRANFEMMSVNCAAIPATLIEAELFGHVKGAFTGATSDRSGLIESADKSTLFLDEIGELPLEAQARLLRVLQEGEIRRVGSTDKINVDVRLIAATNRNLLEMVGIGSFREDLYYRLNVIELTCPALRDREEDISLLANAFLIQSKEKLNRDSLWFSDDTIAAINEHNWPGNVRELQNTIERAVVLCETDKIYPSDLGLRSLPTQFSGKKQRSFDSRPMMSLEDYFQHFVLSHQDQMSETELAQRLGISRKSLWERRNRLGIPRKKDES